MSRIKTVWISVKDELPKVSENASNRTVYVLAALDCGTVTKVQFNDMYKTWLNMYWANVTGDVTHWMPLPTHPERIKNHG